MKILADQNMPLVEDFFSEMGEVTRFEGRSLSSESLKGVDVLLTRSVTKVDKALLEQAEQLKFVGTATIGVDHIDRALLADKQIAFSSAPGCNAIAVAEYVLSAMFAYFQEQADSIEGKTIGIIGVGNIGQTLAEKLKAFNVDILLCDPLRADAGSLQHHTDIDTVIKRADIISCHVPLIKEGPHKTKHLLDKTRLSQLKPGALLINASRGDVIDNQALLAVLKSEQRLEVVLDVWENEPTILTELLSYVRYASVHIAGHTLEGKARGTEMLYKALCETLDLEPTKRVEQFLPKVAFSQCRLEEGFNCSDIGRLIHLVYDIRRDDGLMRNNLSKLGFDTLRKSYPVRREFSTINVQNVPGDLKRVLSALGFGIAK